MKQVYFVPAAAIVAAMVLLSACSKGGSNSNPPPEGTTLAVTSLDVNSGPYTTRVTITGKGFSATPSQDQVSFNGHAAILDAANPTQIIAEVPLAAGTGNVTVTAGGKTATGPVFTYQVAEVVTSIAGTFNGTGFADGQGASASFDQPGGLACDASGNIYVADQGNNSIRKITPDGTVSTIAGNGQQGHTDGAALSASFSKPYGLAVDPSGIVYVADSFNGLIRAVSTSGQVSTLAGNIQSNQPIDGTGSAAGFSRPMGLALDASGNIFVADQGAARIRKVTPAGVVTTVAVSNPIDVYQLVLDKGGNIFVADPTDNDIEKITQAGALSVFAGNSNIIGGAYDGTGTNSGFYSPMGLAIDGAGNLFIVDTGNNLMREITPAAVVTTFLGRPGVNEYGPVAAASGELIAAITVDKAGNIYFIAGNEIRKISMQ